MVKLLIAPILAVLFGIPVFIALAPSMILSSPISKYTSLFLAPILFAISYVLTAGILSMPFHHAIKRGKFPRLLSHPVYGPRRLYALCWTSLYYFTPLYFVILSVPFLKTIAFRLFGYKGPTNFTIYPDTWLRDLPVLIIGENAYLSNRATIGTNMCLIDGSVLVDKVTIGKNGIVGHLAMVAPGSTVGESAEVGVGAALGIRARIKKLGKIGPNSIFNHGSVLGENSEIGPMCYVGVKSIIGDNIKVPGGANIPPGSEILSQADVNNYITSELKDLNLLRQELVRVYQERSAGGLNLVPE